MSDAARIHRAATAVIAAALVILIAAMTGCGGTPAPTVEAAPSARAPTEIAAAQADVAADTVPTIVDARDAVDVVAPPPPRNACITHPDAIALIVRYEVTSPAYYTAHLQAPVWPGESSGVTWGVGYDGGQQTRARIAADWHAHAQVARLAATSGIAGLPARALIPGLADVRTPYLLAADVFGASTLPTYCDLAARTFRHGWDALAPRTRGALVATVYNRGAGMQGDRRREMRELRDACVPAGDVACIARALRSMTRLWAGSTIEAGMRARYEATAALAMKGADA